MVKRCYSLSSSPEESKNHGIYELCVKLVPGGKGSTFLSELREGDSFYAFAPYGNFVYRKPSPGRSICFICTGTGIAPFRSMVRSAAFLSAPPKSAICLFGVRFESELVYRKAFEHSGVNLIPVVSKPSENWSGFEGRVTDYLRELPRDWMWHSTDFYLCGSGEMAEEVTQILVAGHGVNPDAIIRENFSSPSIAPQAPAPQEEDVAEEDLPFPLPIKLIA